MNQKNDANMFDHLEELRRRLIIVLLSVASFSIVCFFFSDSLIEIIAAPIKDSIDSLYFMSPYEAFMAKIKVSLVTGIVIAAPIIFYHLWTFVAPGLYESEKKRIIPLVVSSSALFAVGVSFAYFVIIPFALQFFLDFQTYSLVPLISVGSYLSFFISFILTFGLIFDLPVVLVGLIALGVLGTEFLRAQRKTAVVLIFILAAILTPTVDLITQCLLAVPLWLLFEASLIIGRMVERRRIPV